MEGRCGVAAVWSCGNRSAAAARRRLRPRHGWAGVCGRPWNGGGKGGGCSPVFSWFSHPRREAQSSAASVSPDGAPAAAHCVRAPAAARPELEQAARRPWPCRAGPMPSASAACRRAPRLAVVMARRGCELTPRPSCGGRRAGISLGARVVEARRVGGWAGWAGPKVGTYSGFVLGPSARRRWVSARWAKLFRGYRTSGRAPSWGRWC